MTDEGNLSQEEADNLAYKDLEANVASRGLWAGIADGKVLGTAKNVDGAISLLRDAYSRTPFRHGIIARVGDLREEHEWLAGSPTEA